MTLDMFLRKRGVLRNIKRFSMEHTIKEQNLCEHGFIVANLFCLLSKEIGESISSKDVMLVMNHDFAEVFTGDLNRAVKEKSIRSMTLWEEFEQETIPEDCKQYTDYEIRKELSPKTLLIFELADNLCALLYTLDELLLGNRHLEHAFQFYRAKVLEKSQSLSPKLFDTINSFVVFKAFQVTREVPS